MEINIPESDHCDLCGKAFGFFRHRHKCKRCKQTICADCGKNKFTILVEGEFFNQQQRVCSACFSDINFRNSFLEENGLGWNKPSSRSKLWQSSALKNGVSNDYETQLKEATSNWQEFAIAHRLIQAEVKSNRMERTKFNFSFTEFIYLAQKELEASKDKIKASIENVLVAFHYKTKIAYNTFIPRIVVFLLCFCDEAAVYSILLLLYEKILPSGYWSNGQSSFSFEGLQRDKWTLMQSLDGLMINGSHNMRKNEIDQYLEKIASTLDFFCASLMVNSCNMEILMKHWDELINYQTTVYMKNTILKFGWKLKNFISSNLTVHNRVVLPYLCRIVNPSNLKILNFDLTAINDEQSSMEWESYRKDKDKLNKIAMGLLSKITPENIEVYKKEVDRINKKQFDGKHDSIELSRVLMTAVLVTVGLTDKQAQAIYEILNFQNLGSVNSQRFINVVTFTNTLGGPQQKFVEIFRLKDVDGKEALSVPNAMAALGWVEDTIICLNHISYMLGLKQAWNEFKELVSIKYKSQAQVSLAELKELLEQNTLVFTLIGIQQNSLKELSEAKVLDDGELQKIEKEKYVEMVKSRLITAEQDGKQRIKELQAKIVGLEQKLKDQASTFNKDKQEIITKYESEKMAIKANPDHFMSEIKEAVAKMKEESLRVKKEYETMQVLERKYLDDIKKLKEQAGIKTK